MPTLPRRIWNNIYSFAFLVADLLQGGPPLQSENLGVVDGKGGSAALRCLLQIWGLTFAAATAAPTGARAGKELFHEATVLGPFCALKNKPSLSGAAGASTLAAASEAPTSNFLAGGRRRRRRSNGRFLGGDALSLPPSFLFFSSSTPSSFTFRNQRTQKKEGTLTFGRWLCWFLLPADAAAVWLF